MNNCRSRCVAQHAVDGRIIFVSLLDKDVFEINAAVEQIYSVNRAERFVAYFKLAHTRGQSYACQRTAICKRAALNHKLEASALEDNLAEILAACKRAHTYGSHGRGNRNRRNIRTRKSANRDFRHAVGYTNRAFLCRRNARHVTLSRNLVVENQNSVRRAVNNQIVAFDVVNVDFFEIAALVERSSSRCAYLNYGVGYFHRNQTRTAGKRSAVDIRNGSAVVAHGYDKIFDLIYIGTFEHGVSAVGGLSESKRLNPIGVNRRVVVCRVPDSQTVAQLVGVAVPLSARLLIPPAENQRGVGGNGNFQRIMLSENQARVADGAFGSYAAVVVVSNGKGRGFPICVKHYVARLGKELVGILRAVALRAADCVVPARKLVAASFGLFKRLHSVAVSLVYALNAAASAAVEGYSVSNHVQRNPRADVFSVNKTNLYAVSPRERKSDFKGVFARRHVAQGANVAVVPYLITRRPYDVTPVNHPARIFQRAVHGVIAHILRVAPKRILAVGTGAHRHRKVGAGSRRRNNFRKAERGCVNRNGLSVAHPYLITYSLAYGVPDKQLVLYTDIVGSGKPCFCVNILRSFGRNVAFCHRHDFNPHAVRTGRAGFETQRSLAAYELRVRVVFLSARNFNLVALSVLHRLPGQNFRFLIQPETRLLDFFQRAAIDERLGNRGRVAVGFGCYDKGDSLLRHRAVHKIVKRGVAQSKTLVSVSLVSAHYGDVIGLRVLDLFENQRGRLHDGKKGNRVKRLVFEISRDGNALVPTGCGNRNHVVACRSRREVDCLDRRVAGLVHSGKTVGALHLQAVGHACGNAARNPFGGHADLGSGKSRLGS